MADDDPILKQKYPAKSHCRKVAAQLQADLKDEAPTVFYLQGQETVMQEDNDQAVPFRQRRHFLYLSGCLEPDCHLAYDVAADSLTLFIPPVDPDEVVWSGLPMTQEQAIARYDIDNCLLITEVASHLSSLASQDEKPSILAVTGRGHPPAQPTGYTSTNEKVLHPAIDLARVTKDAYEIALLRKANGITAEAHASVIRAIPSCGNETELEAEFIATCLAHGAKRQGYSSIFGAGTHAATLHYVRNDADLRGRRNILVDAGTEWHGYSADVTRTLPLSPYGFDKESAQIYVIVEQMQRASFAMLKAGVQWESVHLVAHEIAIEGLLSIGILRHGTKEEILKARTSVAFFPHGLGHYLGLDTHDTGGNANYGDIDPLFKYLRVRGTVPERAVITVEPGIYFCRYIIEPYLKNPEHAKFIDESVLEKYWEVGGVRIEDDVLVTKDGYENLTSAPSGIDETMKVMNA